MTMIIRKAALAGTLLFYAMPALAEINGAPHQPTPKSLTSFEIVNQSVEIMAVTRRAQSNTRFHRHYIQDCEDMSGVMPGYPQPALISFDLRFKF